MKSKLMLASFSLCLCLACSTPKRDLTVQQIRQVDNRPELMWVLATVADSRFKLAKSLQPETVSDAHFAEFTDMGRRIYATAQRLPEFSKGKRFDEFALQLASDSQKLEQTASAHQAPETLRIALQILNTCKSCHHEFR